MGWCYGTFRCGHNGRVHLSGTKAELSRKIPWYFENHDCRECATAKAEEKSRKIKEEERELGKKAKELGFPELVSGTQKQKDWADIIRVKLFMQDERMLPVIEEKTESEFWINHRGCYQVEFLSGNLEPVSEYREIKPDNVKYPGCVQIDYSDIREDDKRIYLSYEKNDDFIKIVKNAGLSWHCYTWTKFLDETSGSYKDRMAELGHILLENGFTISMKEYDILEKAKTGEYEKEHTRWIVSVPHTSYLQIRWKGKNDELYKESKKLSKAYWDRTGVNVDVSDYKKIEAFASTYDFRFTKDAARKITRKKEE